MKTQLKELTNNLYRLSVIILLSCIIALWNVAAYKTVFPTDPIVKQEVFEGHEYYFIVSGTNVEIEHKGNCSNPSHSGQRELSQPERDAIYSEELNKRVEQLLKRNEEMRKEIDKLEEKKRRGERAI